MTLTLVRKITSSFLKIEIYYEIKNTNFKSARFYQLKWSSSLALLTHEPIYHDD